MLHDEAVARREAKLRKAFAGKEYRNMRRLLAKGVRYDTLLQDACQSDPIALTFLLQHGESASAIPCISSIQAIEPLAKYHRENPGELRLEYLLEAVRRHCSAEVADYVAGLISQRPL